MKRILTLSLAFTIVLSISITPVFAEETTSTETDATDTVYYLDDYQIDEDYYSNYVKTHNLEGTTLNVYNWGEYISDGSEDSLDVNALFEKLTGIKVNYTNFDSNEDMYAKIKSGGANYDIVIPSDYMIARMKDEGLLEKLDYSNIPNFKYIDDQYKGLYFDENNEYTVAYNVGYVAIVYNKTMVEEKPDSWTCLWDENYAGQILMFNNPRDGFAVAQLLLDEGHNSLNSEDPDDWAMAYSKLLEQKPVVQSYVMDEIFNKMENGEAALAPYYVGDAITMMDNNEDLDVAFPKEGANIFVDSMCIPTTCQNKLAAELYINFMEEVEVALANAEYICYATPNKIVRNLDEYSLRENDILYPDESVTANYQYFYNLPSDIQTLMNNYWSDLKVDGDSNASTYIGLGVFVSVCAVYAIYHKVKMSRRQKYYD